MDFDKVFHHENQDRDKFLSRIFGIFSEDIVRKWASNETSAPYKDEGRPTVKTTEEIEKGKRGRTFDFALREKKTNRLFACEQKCELQFEGYKYLELSKPEQLEHHMSSESFKRFLNVGVSPANYKALVNGRQESVDGTILIWGKVSRDGKEAVRKFYHLHAILSLEEIIGDLIDWRSSGYFKLIDEKDQWCCDLFEDLRTPRC